MQTDNRFLQERNKIVFFDFLFWILLAVIFPAASGHFGLNNILHIFLYFSAVYYAGEILLSKIDVISQIPFLFRSGIYMVLGAIFCGVLFLFFSSGFILYTLSTCLFIDVFFRRRVVFNFSFNYFICLVPFFIMLFQQLELAYAVQKTVTLKGGDYYFYTLIVESLKTNQSLTNAVYQSGLPINYSIAPFLAPAQLAKFAGISAQFSLWGVFGKIIPIVCFGTLSYVVVRVYETLFGSQPNKRIFNKMLLLTSFMLLFLGPLHLLNLVKLDFKNVLLLGEGYVLPIGSPGFALSMFASGLALLFVFSKTKYNVYDKIMIIVLLGIVSGSKIALFLPLGAFLGTLSLLWLFKKQPGLFYTVLLALPFCVLIYMLTLRAKDAIGVLAFTHDGYYQTFFLDVADKYGIHGSAAMKVFLAMSIVAFMWLSIKLLILIISGIALFKTNYRAVSIMVAGIIGLVISTLPAFFLNAYGVDSSGAFLFDGKYDMPQFVRGGIFILSVITCIFALYVIYNYPTIFIKRGMLFLICFWMIPIAYSFFKTGGYTVIKIENPDWYKEATEDFMKAKPKLMAMQGGKDSMGRYYRGMMLTQLGVHPWFCTGTRLQDGYIFVQRAQDRNILFQKIFDSTLSLSLRRSAADSIKMQGVDCVVASPPTLDKILFAQKDSLVSKMPQTKWFYKLN
ncbi:MAG: hypothetical protein ABI402_06355 [Ferruginibacter sp.]